MYGFNPPLPPRVSMAVEEIKVWVRLEVVDDDMV